MSPPRRLRQRAACRVAGYNPDRLNEYVADGTYPCAPSTIPGRARSFDEDDTVALYYFAWLVNEERWAPQKAAREACLIREGLRSYPDAKNLSVIVSHIGSPHIATPGFEGVANPNGWMTGGVSIKATRTYNVGHARALIAHGFDEEFSTAGEED